MVINNSIFSYFNYTLYNTTLKTILTSDVVVQSDLLVSAFLSVLLLASLVLTFSRKGTAIHKVLGLLLTSIFTVFLWIFKTQLLFIYIVYILAFISAVLMLFLSVVMMLPISTISQSTQRTLISSGLPFIFGLSDFIVESILNILILWATLAGLRHFYGLYLFILRDKEYVSEIFASHEELRELLSPRALSFLKNVCAILYGITYYGKNTAKMSKGEFWDDLIEVIINTRSEFKTWNKFVGYSFVAWAGFCIFLILPGEFISRLRDKVWSQNLINKYNTFSVSKKDIVEVIQQSYILIAVIIPFILTTITPWKSDNFTLPAPNSIQGIGDIKELLYGDFALFLIFSTVVLLVALFGAAVMTRKK